MAEEKPQSLDTQPANIPLLDPTINVQNLLAAAILRVNDLATAEKERINERTCADMLRLDQLREAETRRVNEAIASEGRRINEQMALREHYEEELRLAEAKRIDANRAGDAAAVATANERACVSFDTPILCADLIWRQAGDLTVGDELIAFDEEAELTKANGKTSRGRHYRKAIVIANSLKKDDLLLVTTPKGAVKCNPQHPWLVKRIHGHDIRWRWIQAKYLRVGDEVMHAVDVWTVDTSYEAGWLAGIIDGEGCLTDKSSSRNHSRLTITQADGIVSDVIGKVMMGRISSTKITPYQIKNRKAAKRFVVAATADIMKIIGSIRPSRMIGRSQRIWDGLYIGGTGRSTTVTSIDTFGSGTIASLATDTHTYIAAGFAMHNTQQAAVLASQMATMVENTRALVDANAAASSQQLQSAITAMNERLQNLEKMGWEGAGKEKYSDPALVNLVEQVRLLTSGAATNSGKGQGANALWGYIVGGIGLLALIIDLVTRLSVK